MKNGRIDKTYYVSLLPVVLTLVILPLAVKVVNYYNPAADYAWSNSTKYAGDIFLLIKQHLLYLIMGLMAFFLLCFLLLRRKIFRGTKQMMFLAGYLLLALLSTVLADNSYIAWHGGAERFESIFVLAGYVLLFYYTYIVIRGEQTHAWDARRFLVRAVGVLSFLLGIVGVFQMFGFDIYQNAFIAKICGLQNADYVASDRIYISLYHSDYVGVMMTMLLPMNVAGLLIERKRRGKLFFMGDILLLVLCLFASQSRFAVICLLVCGFIFYPLWLSQVQQKKKFVLGTLLCLVTVIGLFTVVNRIQGYSLMQRFLHTESTTRTDTIFLETGDEGIVFHLKGTSDYQARFAGKGENLELLLQDSAGQSVMPGQGELSEVTVQKQYVTYEGKTVYGFTFFHRKQSCFLTNQLGDHKYYYLNILGKFDQCVLAEDAFPSSWYGVASYRGYVWSKTIPLLKQTMIHGAGPDNFEGYFPNNDYTSRYYSRLKKVVYNKPHSWYLQMAAETGVLSAVLVIVFLAGMVIRGMRVLWKNRTEGSLTEQSMLMAGMFACISYCLMGLLNDSMLVVAPVFWVILGFTYALLQEKLASDENMG